MTESLVKIVNRTEDDDNSINDIDRDKKNKEIKNKIRNERREGNKNKLEEIRSRLNEQQRKINDANQESGSYNWLTVLTSTFRRI